MVIARMLLRGGLLTLALASTMATAKAVCRIIVPPAPRDAEPQRARSERVHSQSASKSRRQRHSPRSSERRRA
jgi:hypothetical protein